MEALRDGKERASSGRRRLSRLKPSNNSGRFRPSSAYHLFHFAIIELKGIGGEYVKILKSIVMGSKSDWGLWKSQSYTG